MTWPPPCDDQVAIAWADTRGRYRIPSRYAEQLVQGVAADLQKKRYASFDELAVYCYGVASTVGLMSMHIIGFADRRAIPYAVKLGLAMQITNILRDVRSDAGRGRIYLPLTELKRFRVTEAEILAGLDVPGRPQPARETHGESPSPPKATPNPHATLRPRSLSGHRIPLPKRPGSASAPRPKPRRFRPRSNWSGS